MRSNKGSAHLRNGWMGIVLLLSAPVMAQEPITSSISEGGSAIVVPYYTVNESWSTLINLTNTTPNSLAVKLRLLEARNGRDVLNFVVLLAPTDVWAGWVSADPSGRPVVRTTDSSCTVPLAARDASLTASEIAYSRLAGETLPAGDPGRFTDHTGTDGDPSRMSEGYVEILAMGEAQGRGAEGSIPWYASTVGGQPRDCARVAAAFDHRTEAWDGTGPIPGDAGAGDPLAREEGNYRALQSQQPLRANVTLVNQSRGMAAGIPSTHLAGWGLGENLVTAATFPWRLEPTLAADEGLWTTTGLSRVNDALLVTHVNNEWTRNAATGASADWVLTFPTKRYQTDEHYGDVYAGCSAWRNDSSSSGRISAAEGNVFEGWPADDPDSPRGVRSQIVVTIASVTCPQLRYFGPTFYESAPFQENNNGRREIPDIHYQILDREAGRGSMVKPVEGAADVPPYVANVLSIGTGTALSSLDSAIALPIDTGTLGNGAANGWMRYGFGGTAEQPASRAVTGFVFKLRDFGAPSQNFSQATSHGYQR